jgi:hypothetical protein
MTILLGKQYLQQSMRASAWIAVLLVFGLTACSPQAVNQPLIEEESMEVNPGQTIQVDIDAGEIQIGSSAGNQLEVRAELSNPARTHFQLERTLDGAQISCTGGSSRDTCQVLIELGIPEGVIVSIDGYAVDITMRRMNGEVRVFTTVGDISLQDSTGIFNLNSNRGDIDVVRSKGSILVSGNYGLLSVDDSHGDIGISTIMGTIRFLGSPIDSDIIRLETDHGPVEVQLGDGSSLRAEIETTSGQVACTIFTFTPVGRGCTGLLGDGSATLWVRTVSGAVSLQSLQPKP